MKKWLIILCLAALAAPNVAMAASRPVEVPFWKRVLNAILPGTAAQGERVARPLRRQRGGLATANFEPNFSRKAAQPQSSRKESTVPPAANAEAKGPFVAAPRSPSHVGEIKPPTEASELKQAKSTRAANSDENQDGLATGGPPSISAPASAPSASAPHVAEIPVAAPRVVAAPQQGGDIDQVGSSIAPETYAPLVPLPTPLPRKRVGSIATGTEEGALPPIFVAPEAEAPAPLAVPDRTRPGARSADCNGGERIVSAYYSVGRHTASGQPFNPHGMTAAHRTLPFGTRLTVTNPRTGQSVTVVINDRGPFVRGVSLDLSQGAAKAIGMHGTGSVCVL
jgi:rare lipoprotein A